MTKKAIAVQVGQAHYVRNVITSVRQKITNKKEEEK